VVRIQVNPGRTRSAKRQVAGGRTAGNGRTHGRPRTAPKTVTAEVIRTVVERRGGRKRRTQAGRNRRHSAAGNLVERRNGNPGSNGSRWRQEAGAITNGKPAIQR